MGKSPGKWIKALLLGKKGSKSNLSKGREVLRTANENETLVVAKAPGVETPVVSHVAASTTDENGRNIASENGVLSNEQHDSEILPRNQDQSFQGTTGPGAGSDSERARQDQAATKAQAAFRGYLARRAFRALKGIIRLQALIRGHLVRRQAAATLRCMQGIVRFQALVRGRRVRISDAGIEVHCKCNVGKIQEGQHLEPVKMNSKIQREVLSTNAFAVKLLASMSTALPLRLQYGPGEPNSALNWLECWSSTHFWQPLPQAKKNVDSKSQARQGNRQSAGTEPVRSKRTFRKLSTANVDNGSIHSTSESEKPKRSVRKVVSHPVDPVVDPQTELEKVKRSLRKVSSSTAEVSDRVEAEIEKPKRVPRKVSSAAAADVSDQGMVDSIEKIKKDAIVEAPKMPDVEASPVPKMPDVEETPVPKMPDVEATPMPKMLDVEATPMPLTSDEPVENVTVANHDKGVQALERGVQDENIPVTNSELNSKEDQTGSINPKSSKRRASLPAKQEYPENGLRNTPTVPSYMAATESAKAKLRAQGSPRFGHDEIEKNGFTRRHSLPSSTNGKLNSDSPRTQRLVNGSGKSGGRDRSLLSSRDGNAKAVQAEWRR